MYQCHFKKPSRPNKQTELFVLGYHLSHYHPREANFHAKFNEHKPRQARQAETILLTYAPSIAVALCVSFFKSNVIFTENECFGGKGEWRE